MLGRALTYLVLYSTLGMMVSWLGESHLVPELTDSSSAGRSVSKSYHKQMTQFPLSSLWRLIPLNLLGRRGMAYSLPSRLYLILAIGRRTPSSQPAEVSRKTRTTRTGRGA